ncbi:MAG: hypothetical protein JO084_00250 [Bradyrhizobiaceae bacterium]|nr:hypothetical protein [Bradyrhizobiaceae bacterium]
MPREPNENDQFRDLVEKLIRALAERGYEVRPIAGGYRGFQEEDSDWSEIQAALRTIIEDGTIDATKITSDAQGPAMSSSDELTDAKVAAAEARTDAKIARSEGKLDLVLSKLDDMREDNRSLRTNINAVGIGLALLMIACVAGAPVVIDFGFKLRETISREVHDQVRAIAPQRTP